MPRIKDKPSKREVRNLLTFYAGGTTMEAPKVRGRQPEGLVNDDIAAKRHEVSGLYLERNKRRLAVPVGYHEAIMLGWGPDGAPDWNGDFSIVITPAMVGKRISPAIYVETKTEKGVVSDAQETFLNAATDRGAIAGVARSGADINRIVAMWLERLLR